MDTIIFRALRTSSSDHQKYKERVGRFNESRADAWRAQLSREITQETEAQRRIREIRAMSPEDQYNAASELRRLRATYGLGGFANSRYTIEEKINREKSEFMTKLESDQDKAFEDEA